MSGAQCLKSSTNYPNFFLRVSSLVKDPIEIIFRTHPIWMTSASVCAKNKRISEKIDEITRLYGSADIAVLNNKELLKKARTSITM